MKSDVYVANLMAAMHTRPSRSGARGDKKVCDAKPGECRGNTKYYTSGLKDKKSWSLPFSDNNCPNDCPYLVTVSG